MTMKHCAWGLEDGNPMSFESEQAKPEPPLQRRLFESTGTWSIPAPPTRGKLYLDGKLVATDVPVTAEGLPAIPIFIGNVNIGYPVVDAESEKNRGA